MWLLTFRLKEIYIKYGFLDLEESENSGTWGSHPASSPPSGNSQGELPLSGGSGFFSLTHFLSAPSLRAIVSCHLVTVHCCASLTLSLLLSYMALRPTPGAVKGVPFNGPGCAEEAPWGRTPRTAPSGEAAGVTTETTAPPPQELTRGPRKGASF